MQEACALHSESSQLQRSMSDNRAGASPEMAEIRALIMFCATG
jgi:hypothetical protein